MSIAVAIDELANTLAKFPFVYLLTVGEKPRPHISAQSATMNGGTVVLADTGRGSRERIAVNELVTLLAPPYEPGGYSLIIDGTAVADGDRVLVTPTWAVLHRPAATQAPTTDGSCAQDCVEVPTNSAPGVLQVLEEDRDE
jgi:hypothetical protein